MNYLFSDIFGFLNTQFRDIIIPNMKECGMSSLKLPGSAIKEVLKS